MKLHKLLLTITAGALFFVSCSSDDNADKPSGAYDNGVLVLNQGNFTRGNSSISFISDALTLEDNIFEAVNQGTRLGDTGQDIGLTGQFAYIVMITYQKLLFKTFNSLLISNPLIVPCMLTVGHAISAES